ncbi:MAG: histidine phosphatase family protein [bacterium]|nr:histidine phosphatase family protein [bacterium]
MAKLFLLRHLKSQWNGENRFTGWMDVPLDEKEIYKAEELADKIFKFQIDKIYTSSLFRNQDTVARIFEYGNIKYPVFVHLDGGKMQKWANFIDISENDVTVFVTEKLNERYYGKIQGESKDEAIRKYGAEKVRLWRRSYNVAPPGGESLKDVYKRAVPFYKKYAEKDLLRGKNVLIVASHNSLRALVKYLEKISDQDIINLEIDYGALLEYQIDKQGIAKKQIFC